MGIQYCTKDRISPNPWRGDREFGPGPHPLNGMPAFGCDERRPLVAPTGVGRANLEGRSEQHAPPDTSIRWPVIQLPPLRAARVPGLALVRFSPFITLALPVSNLVIDSGRFEHLDIIERLMCFPIVERLSLQHHFDVLSG